MSAMRIAPWHRVTLATLAVGWGANQFSPMLVVYRDELGLTDRTTAVLFALYAVGLIPGLLVGGAASDRHGRRAVVLPLVVPLPPVATLMLVAFRHAPLGLGAARLLAGVCSGVVFGAATAWVRELSAGAADGVAARRAATALTAGFASGRSSRRCSRSGRPVRCGAVPPAPRPGRRRRRAAAPGPRRRRAAGAGRAAAADAARSRARRASADGRDRRAVGVRAARRSRSPSCRARPAGRRCSWPAPAAR